MDHSEYKEALDAYKQERLPVVLTAAEAMDILGVEKNTMYRLLKSGKLPAVRIGRRWRISLNSLEKTIHQKRRIEVQSHDYLS